MPPTIWWQQRRHAKRKDPEARVGRRRTTSNAQRVGPNKSFTVATNDSQASGKSHASSSARKTRAGAKIARMQSANLPTPAHRTERCRG